MMSESCNTLVKSQNLNVFSSLNFLSLVLTKKVFVLHFSSAVRTKNVKIAKNVKKIIMNRNVVRMLPNFIVCN